MTRAALPQTSVHDEPARGEPARDDPATPPEPTAAQVFVIDDNDGFRNSTRWLLESHGFAVDAFANARHFLAYLEAWPRAATPACILLDMRMPEMSGLEVQDALRRRGCTLPVVFVSGHGDVPLAVEAMRRGAAHFLEKPFRDEVLVEALNDALNHGAPRVAPGDSDADARDRLASLTSRERQVLDLAVEGRLNKTIADRLGISIKTVELHRSRVMMKMRAKSIAQLVQLTMRGGGL
jgi:two-component system, LuxR family, response regulator FixJ